MKSIYLLIIKKVFLQPEKNNYYFGAIAQFGRALEWHSRG